MYQNLFETPALVLDRSLKGYTPALFLYPRFNQGTANEYLTLLHQQSQMVETFDFFQIGHAESTVLMVTERPISAMIVCILVQAAREQRRVGIDDVSLSAPKIIGPNIVTYTIVKDGY